MLLPNCVLSFVLKMRVWHVLIVVMWVLIMVTHGVMSLLARIVDELLKLGLSPEQLLMMVGLGVWWMLVSTTFASALVNGAIVSRRFLRRACGHLSLLMTGVETAQDRFELAMCLANLKLEQLL